MPLPELAGLADILRIQGLEDNEELIRGMQEHFGSRPACDLHAAAIRGGDQFSSEMNEGGSFDFRYWLVGQQFSRVDTNSPKGLCTLEVAKINHLNRLYLNDGKVKRFDFISCFRMALLYQV